MFQERDDLKPFNMEQLEEIRRLRAKMYCGGNHKVFMDELQLLMTICKTTSLFAGDVLFVPYGGSKEWELLAKDETVVGDIWKRNIGVVYHKNTIHEFTYYYVESEGQVIEKHENKIQFEDHTTKVAEWYIFPDGNISYCRKGEKHELNNPYNKPFYLVLVQVYNRG